MVLYETLEDYIDAMLQKITNRQQWNSEMINNLLKFSYNLNFITLKEYYDEIKETNTTDEVYKAIICLCLFQLLNRNFINSSYHDLVVECLTLLAQEGNFNIEALKDKIVLQSLKNTSCEDETWVAEFGVIMREFALIYKISLALEKFGKEMSLELEYISSPAKTHIMELLTDDTKIYDAIKKIRLAKKNNMELVNVQSMTAMFIEEYCKEGKIQDNPQRLIDLFDDSNIEDEQFQEPEPIIINNTPVPNKPILRELPQDDFGKITKLETKYLNSQGIVSVSIFECHREGFAEKVALKECKTKFIDNLSGFIEEAKILRTLSGKSENFLKFYGERHFVEDVLGVKTYILQIQMEYVEKTLKEDREHKLAQGYDYSEYEFETIYRQLVSALSIMRVYNIIHCDIKPSNILITDKGVLKIIDFNAAKAFRNTTVIGNYAGTLDFMAPEVLEGHHNGHVTFKQDKPDVFSLGMTLLFLLTKESINGLNQKCNEEKLLKIIESIPIKTAIAPLKKMLDHNPDKRSGINNLIELSERAETILK